ncbi:hypothetical protein L248_1018 [Schleiferilactobacillus shenzhenensis LY-73]|uniref:Uncharacterized protein n=1 Tax=Schleiferilactobacillus shenzhenensis LY-73 TaxID=1231336 RepID=U4THV5_9LACO|nr:hypothetical protein L248_1018 [Schleiferilactobacillus shenzhenensis LY-73]
MCQQPFFQIYSWGDQNHARVAAAERNAAAFLPARVMMV